MTVLIFPFLLMVGCNSYTWEDAQQTDTYEAYKAYIEENPQGEFVDEARELAELRYWDSIKKDSTATSFQTYLNRFPNGQFQSEAEEKLNQLARANLSSEGRVTGSNVIIRSDHTTESSSVGVVAREGTVVNILDFYSSGNSKEAILSSDVRVLENGRQINLSSGKAINILSDRMDSVRVSVSTAQYGKIEVTVSKENIEPMSGEKWYKITTRDDISGWIYGKFIEEL
ncbi:MAG: hypothetical protein U5K72_07020 [Balneolaceae bacterium]|nr:hypothetical protein [Balneolaceae bacterium]